MHRDDGHLRAGFLFQFGAQRFEFCFGVSVERASQVGYVADWLDFGNVFRAGKLRKAQREVQDKKTSGKGEAHFRKGNSLGLMTIGLSRRRVKRRPCL